MKRKGIAIVSLIIVMLNFNLLVEAQEASDPVVVRHASGTIIIDGNLDEPDWQNAQLVGPFLIYPTRNPEDNELTHAKMLWDEQNLYIAFKSYDTNIVATRMERNIDVWKDDCVEAFISPYLTIPEKYLNIEINPIITYFCGIHLFEDGSRWYTPSLQIGRQHEGTINNEGDKDKWWIIEVAIPFQMFSVLGYMDIPKPGDTWRFNLYRLARNTEPARRNLFYLPEPLNNHSPEYYGKLIFSEKTWMTD